MMKKLIRLIAALAILLNYGTAIAQLPLGSADSTKTNVIAGSLQVNKAVKFKQYKNTADTSQQFNIDANGNPFFQPKSVSGSITDTSIIATKWYVRSAISDTAASIRAMMVSLFSGYYTKTQVDAFFTNYYTKSQADGLLATKSDVGHTHAYSSLTGIPSTFPPSAHTHPQSEVTGLVAALAALKPSGDSTGNSGYETNYGTDSMRLRINTALASKAALSHTHAQSDVTGLISALAAKQDALGYAPENVANKVTNFTGADNIKYPSALTVKNALDGKSDIGHTHSQSEVTSLVTDLASKKPSADSTGVTGYETNYGTDTMRTRFNNDLGLRLRYTDTPSMLLPYLRKVDTTLMLSPYVRSNIAAATYMKFTDSAAMLTPYLRKIDTTLMLSPYIRTNVANSSFVSLSGSYTNPSWLVSIPWSKVTGTPTTLAGYGITNAVSGSGTNNYIPAFTGTSTISTSPIQTDGSNIGVGVAVNPSYRINTNALVNATGYRFSNNDGIANVTNTAINMISNSGTGWTYNIPGGGYSYVFKEGTNPLLTIGSNQMFFNTTTNAGYGVDFNASFRAQTSVTSAKVYVTNATSSNLTSDSVVRVNPTTKELVMIPNSAGGGGGSPAGSGTEVQYRNGSSFGASSKVSIQAEGYTNVGTTAYNGTVTAPASGATIYARSLSGTPHLSVIGTGDAMEKQMQAYMGTKRIGFINAGTNALTQAAIISGGMFGNTGSNLGGTISAGISPGGSSLLAKSLRIICTTAASTNSSSGVSPTAQSVPIYRGNTALGGGFEASFTFGITTTQSACRYFIGFATTTPSASADPSAITNMVGIGKDAGDANIQWMSNDGTSTATKSSTGVAIDNAGVYRLFISCKPNSSSITMSLIKYTTTGVTAIGETTISSDLPTVNTGMIPIFWVNTGSQSSAVVGDMLNMYVETDF